MLLTESIEQMIESILASIGDSFSVYMIGRNLGQGTAQAIASSVSLSNMTMVEQAFLAGKLAREVGVDALKKMTEQEIADLVFERGLALTAAEQAKVQALSRDTQRWLKGRNDAWAQRVRGKMADANQGWRSVISGMTIAEAQAVSVATNPALVESLSPSGLARVNAAADAIEARALSSLGVEVSVTRQGALASLVDDVAEDLAVYRGDMDRIVQSEMNMFFQEGQMHGIGDDEEVYKIPRNSACKHCLRIHLKADGSPKIYKLKAVRVNSNRGKKPYSWGFVVGPTHPHCYCILHRVKEKKPPGPNATLASAISASKLKKSLSLVDALEDVHFDDPPEYVKALMKSIKDTVEDKSED